MIKPYNLGEVNLVENTHKIEINALLRQITKNLKRQLVSTEIESQGFPLTLTASVTRFRGERLWFVCPLCKSRKGIIFNKAGSIGCRNCLGLKYRKQRYKGMAENQII